MSASNQASQVVHELSEQLRETGKVGRVFGEPQELKGRILLPVASVSGGGGGGGGSSPGEPEHEHAGASIGHGRPSAGEGAGAGMGVNVRPLGWLIVTDEKVSWQPVIDVSRILTLAAVFGIFALWGSRKNAKAKAKARMMAHSNPMTRKPAA